MEGRCSEARRARVMLPVQSPDAREAGGPGGEAMTPPLLEPHRKQAGVQQAWETAAQSQADSPPTALASAPVLPSTSWRPPRAAAFGTPPAFAMWQLGPSTFPTIPTQDSQLPVPCYGLGVVGGFSKPVCAGMSSSPEAGRGGNSVCPWCRGALRGM